MPCDVIAGQCGAVDADTQSELVVEVPLFMGGPVPILRAEFLGEVRSFILDTGTSDIAVNRDLKSHLGSPKTVETASTPSGAVRIEVYPNRAMKLNNRSFYGEVIVGPNDVDVSLLGCQVAGFLGMEAFQDYAIEINPDNEVFRVYDRVPDGIIKKSVLFPLRVETYRPIATLELPKLGLEEFLLDTGGSGSMMLRGEAFDKLVRSGDIKDCFYTPLTTVVRVEKIVKGKLSDFTVGKFNHDTLNVMRRASPSGLSSVDWRYLRRYIMVVDFVHKRLYLQPSKYHDSPELLDKSGLQLISRDGAILIAVCTTDSPADKAGLRAHDIISHINGKASTEFSLREISDFLCQEHETIRIAATRGETPINAEFQLEEFRTFQLNELKLK